ncbi:MAG: M48 family metallopeptidase [Clostridia bacterium]|nr:M48 family metallopeptidase [Clostridia bacterium]
MKYDYELVRKNRSGISISISDKNKITVKCPLSVSQKKIDEVLEEKSAWIEKVILKNSILHNEHGDILNYRKVYVNGTKTPFFNCSDRNVLTDYAVHVKSKRSLKSLFCDMFSADFLETINVISNYLSLIPQSVTIKDYVSRWGCCDINNNLVFNYKVFMLPTDLREYVIVHELCHIKHHNHSTDFWGLLGSILPDYKKRQKRLRDFDFITRLY